MREGDIMGWSDSRDRLCIRPSSDDDDDDDGEDNEEDVCGFWF